MSEARSDTRPGNNSVTSASEWKKKSHNTLVCPSGATVVVRRVSLATLAMTGRVPEALLTGYLEGIKALDTLGRSAQEGDVDIAQLAKSAAVMDAVLIAALESPRVSLDETTEETINVRDVPDEDRMFLFQNAIQGTPNVPVKMEGGEVKLSDLSTFRQDEGLSSTGEDGRDIPSETVAVVGD